MTTNTIEKDLKSIRAAEHQATSRMEAVARECEARLENARAEGKREVQEAITSARNAAKKELEVFEKDLKTKAVVITADAEEKAKAVITASGPRVEGTAKLVSERVLRG